MRVGVAALALAAFCGGLSAASEAGNSGIYEVESRNVTEILNRLTSDYDKRLRPNYGGEPVLIEVTMHVSDISAISEVAMDYTLDIYLRQFWRDPRLTFTGINESLTIGIEMVHSIWVPDTFFPNEKKSAFHEATTHNSFLRINHHGNITRSMRLTVTANCPMNLQFFPLDSQNCSLEIESYGYSTRDIIYTWKKGKDSVSNEEGINLAQFRIGKIVIQERMINLSTGNYSRLSAYFSFERAIGFYLIQIYLPSSLIVVISWVSFWLNREATQARVAIGVTTVLTMTTLMTSTNSSMPKVSYVKSIDIYLGTCFIIVFASLLEYAAVGYLMKRMRMTKDERRSLALTQSGGGDIPVDRRLQALSEDHSWMQDESNQYYQLVNEQRAQAGTSFIDDRKRSSRRRGSERNSFIRQGYAPIGSPMREGVGCSDGDPLLLDATGPSRLGGGVTPRLSYASMNHSNNSGGAGRGGSFPFPPVSAGLLSPDSFPCDCDVEFGFGAPPPSAVTRPPRADWEERMLPIRRSSHYSAQSFKPSNIDKYSRIFFPLTFISFHIVYWTVYLNAAAIFGHQ